MIWQKLHPYSIQIQTIHNSSLVRNFTSRLEILKPKLKETQLEGIDKAINSTQDMIELKKIIVVQLNKDFKILLEVKGSKLENIEYQHPTKNKNCRESKF